MEPRLYKVERGRSTMCFIKKRGSELMSITLPNLSRFQSSFIVTFCDKFGVKW